MWKETEKMEKFAENDWINCSAKNDDAVFCIINE